ncbi:MAG: hypothetical protein IT320_08975 [Anaerolineae bacterium]|nr:hypothetical protein [Anaerolineae bacterium]
MKTFKLLVLCAVWLLATAALAFAQPSAGTRPAPSGGGGAGGPGIGGSAMSAGFSSVQMPSGEVGSGWSGSGIDRSQAGRGGAGARTSGGLTTESMDQIRQSLQGRGGGFDPSGRFSERGTGSIPLDLSALFGDDPSFSGFGGFGTRSQRGEDEGAGGNIGTALQEAGWQPDALEGTVPETPGAYSDLTGIAQVQADAQAAVEGALQDASDSAQQAAQQATAAAQQAYDQFWNDYYSAVNYTANTYYNTVSASADYLLQTYEQAVNYTTASVDYYLAYAEQYVNYCAAYPWDCYSYVYDATYNTYVYVGDISDEPVGTVTVGDVTTSVSINAAATPTPSAEAYEALVVFANDQLGAVIEPLYAGEATDAVLATFSYLPAELQAYLSNATSISGAAYWGLLNGGVGGVMVGDCAANSANCTISTDNLSTQLTSAAAGAYGLLTTGAMPATPGDALDLITTVYPKLDGLAFAQVTDVDGGLAFTATAASMGYDAATMQPVSVAKVVYAGVVDVNGQAFVYALVGVGEGYVQVLGGMG